MSIEITLSVLSLVSSIVIGVIQIRISKKQKALEEKITQINQTIDNRKGIMNSTTGDIVGNNF